MSVQPRAWPEVPEQTVVVARAAFPKGTLAMRVRDELPGLFADEQFASAFGVRGKPGISPGQLALVTVLQFAEHLTDRQAADAVRARIDWKYALGLDLSDSGFDHTVLTGFRQRLIDHQLEEKVLDLLLARLVELGLVKPGGGSVPTPRMCWRRCGRPTGWSFSPRPCAQPCKHWPRPSRTG
jgi:transposase